MIDTFQSFLQLRSRSNWEACDSGILIWRNSIAYMLLFMGIPFLCCVIVLAFLNSYMPYFSVFILWWLLPFFDRLILQVISVRFFKSDADYKTIRRRIIKTIFKGLIGDLTWRRLSMYRAARLPVRILEGNKKKAIKRRIKNLKNGGLDFCAFLTWLCIIIEIVLFSGFALILFGFLGEYADLSIYTISNYAEQVSLAVLFITSLVILIVEPLYMCMGFGLYINSRSIVEGWDIELTFHSFIKEKQIKSSSIKTQHVAKIFLFAMLLLSTIIQPLQAEEWYQKNQEEVPVEVLDEVLSSEDFGSSRTRKWIRFKDTNDDESSSPFRFDEFNIKEAVGIILRALLVVIIIAGIIFAAYRLYKTRKHISSVNSIPRRKNILPGFADKKNPEILIGEAKKLFKDGKIRKAWSFCLSAVLGLYADKGNIRFALNDTESDCLARIHNSLLWGKEESAQLVLHWIQLAYAGIEVDSKYFDDAVSFYHELKMKLLISGDTNE